MNLYKTAAVVTLFTAFEHSLGFLYRIILSRTLGSEGLGVYQVALSVFAVFLTISSSGLPITLSRVISKHRAQKYKRGEHAATSAAMLISLMFSLPITILLFVLRAPFSQIFSDPRCADLFYILIFGLSFTSLYSIIRGSFWGNKRFFAYSFIELVEEIIMIAVGVLMLIVLKTGLADVNIAAIAVLVSYLCSFVIAVFYFFLKGGKLSSPRGEFLPLLKSSLPVTAMRTSSSLVGSLISVIFPMRLMAAGASSSKALAEYGIVYGMVAPVIFIPNTLISSMALVLVPELSECYYKKETEKLSALVKRAITSALLIAGVLIPFFIACGESVGIFLFASAESGRMIASCALMLVPMSLTMISTSILNSMNCEKQTLLIFLLGSAAMLVCVWTLPALLGSGALLVGMAADFTVTAVCSLILLRKKTGRFAVGKYILKLLLLTVPVTLLGVLVRMLLMRYLSYVPALVLTILLIGGMELVLLQLLGLVDLRKYFKKIFHRRRAKSAAI